MTTTPQPIPQLILAELMQNPGDIHTTCQSLGISPRTFRRNLKAVRRLALLAGYAVRRPTRWDGDRYRATKMFGKATDVGIHSGINLMLKYLRTLTESILRDARVAHDEMVATNQTTSPDYLLVLGLMGTLMQMQSALTGQIVALA